MTQLKILVLALVLPLLSTMTTHKYYVSVTQMEYVKSKKSLQIITRIDVSDLQLTLRERYDDSITLTEADEKASVNDYIKKYLAAKLDIKVNTKELTIDFVGKEYDNDQVVCYLEIQDVASVKTMEISNTVLFDKFPDQRNVLKIKVNGERFNLVCAVQDQTQYLNF
ncbi:peptidase E [Subsaximicrobium wynnwilliamsii]|uniref:Peptidase E n=1 Tax=Subsaximicrobium wynnwilliamsii TaxID=291179 RepID=A0A5C6ZNL9_9FLAO|nr:DUF6702 family protein [Subsaximicrobium wynnwilliamsii]TXD84598.1 peptidase E [Subsaximicrobium wynnwilliamsii]TXD90280.1 peptidase E [Subsaximicrobium wynnwilliamsii]TXE04331.1 peptidase E [Subsaximicrobium wynnwilliamsii]